MQSFDNSIHTGYQFILEKFDGDQLKEKLVANTITYDSVKRVWSIKSFSVKYINGLKEKFVNNIGVSKDTVLDMRPEDFVVVDNQYTAMPTSELHRDIIKERIRGTGALKEMLYDFYQRFVYALSSYVLMLIGVSISSRKVRGGIGLPLGIGIFLCFTYIVVDRFAFVFAVKGELPSLIAVFIPSVIFGAIGIYLMAKAPK
jgi:lipopolysaccharide export system permease protein